MNLDNLKEIDKMDKDLLVANSIAHLPKQISHVMKDSSGIKIPANYKKNITQVVINGMGGSNLGAGIVKAVFAEELKLPITINPGYLVPKHINNKTLYIISSYSGTTEEPISTYNEAVKRRAKIMAITSDENGKLEKMMKTKKIPGYIFDPCENPSKQPRIGAGYSIFGMAMLLSKAGLFKINRQEVKNTIELLEKNGKKLAPKTKITINPAKKLATKLKGKEPVYVSAEFLLGNLRVIRNQTCENAKNFASYLTVPELNHYAMEGLAHPDKNKKNLIFVIFTSKLFHPRVQKRNKLTAEIIKKNGVEVVIHELKGKTKLEQSIEMLQLGTWTTYYLGILNQVDPIKIPWVDMFKKKLG